MKNIYKQQVALLIDVLTEIVKDDIFALHGGTAINLFHLNMPRFSVDIDLTYIPFSNNRDKDIFNIRQSLKLIKTRLRARFPNIRFEDEKRADGELKLLCLHEKSIVKVEVNQINRGLIAAPCTKILCSRAEEEFDRFCQAQTVSDGQLWGGKINAALDRQHPRDIFDVKNLLQEISFTEEIKQGFIFFLLCSKRPIDEILNPNFTNQRVVFTSQFSGMTNEAFTYAVFEEIREKLVAIIRKSLTQTDKNLIFSFATGHPDWNSTDYSCFPAIKWKLLNIDRLKATNPIKYRESILRIEKLLADL